MPTGWGARPQRAYPGPAETGGQLYPIGSLFTGEEPPISKVLITSRVMPTAARPWNSYYDQPPLTMLETGSWMARERML